MSLEEVTVRAGHDVLIQVDDNISATVCWSTGDFRPVPQVSPNSINKYYCNQIKNYLYYNIVAIIFINVIILKINEIIIYIIIKSPIKLRTIAYEDIDCPPPLTNNKIIFCTNFSLRKNFHLLASDLWPRSLQGQIP